MRHSRYCSPNGAGNPVKQQALAQRRRLARRAARRTPFPPPTQAARQLSAAGERVSEAAHSPIQPCEASPIVPLEAEQRLDRLSESAGSHKA
jgi:hypothetical protein